MPALTITDLDERLTMATDTVGRFYVYIYRDPRPGKDNAPIYVGKGKYRRAYKHWEKGTHNLHLDRVLAKIRAAGIEPLIEIVSRFVHEVDAFTLEKALIATYGRRNIGTGTLCNLTDGGDGIAGFSHSKETLKKMGVSQKLLSEKMKLVDPEKYARNIKKLEEAGRRALALVLADSDRTALMMSRRNSTRKKNGADPEIAGRRRTANLASVNAMNATLAADPAKMAERTARNRVAVAEFWADSEKSEKQKKRLAAQSRGMWQDSEKRQKTIDAQRAGWKNKVRVAVSPEVLEERRLRRRANGKRFYENHPGYEKKRTEKLRRDNPEISEQRALHRREYHRAWRKKRREMGMKRS